MVTPCSGGGVGVPKAGFAATQFIGPGAIGGALASLSGWQGAAVGAAIGAVSYELATFCPAGPPATPTFTASDIIALLVGPNSTDYNTASAKFRDFLGAVFWPIFCECSSGTVVAPAPSTYPTGGLAVPASGGQVGAICQSRHGQLTTMSPTSGGLATTFVAGVTGKTNLIHTHIATTLTVGTVVAASVQLRYTEVSGQTPINFGPLRQIAQNQTYDFWDEVPSLTVFNVTMVDTYVGGGGTMAVVTDMDNYCNGSPFVTGPCCPPDNATQASLDAILNLVTLIQRQVSPFGYVYGANHTGLSGHGSFAVSDLLGVSVDVTTLPSSYGQATGTPTELFGLGFVTLGTADGYETSHRIDHDGSLVLPYAAGAFTLVGYSLSPGVVVSIRELTREP